MSQGRSRKPTETEGGTYASPPCFMHELDPAYAGTCVDQRQAQDVARWRKAERTRLIAARLAISPEARAKHANQLIPQLDALVSHASAEIVSVYWPFRGEPDMRPWMHSLHARGIMVALPVVIGKTQPLIFRAWSPKARMERGVWNIPVPADGPPITPTVVIAPVVGFDAENYRLGYGGGFYDRTLAQLGKKVHSIGIGQTSAEIRTIYPQPHDIPMDWIVTGTNAPRARPEPPGSSRVEW